MLRNLAVAIVIIIASSPLFGSPKCDRVDIRIEPTTVKDSLSLAQTLGELTTSLRDPGKCFSRVSIVGIDGFGPQNHQTKPEYIAVGLEIDGDCPGYSERKISFLKNSKKWTVKSVEPSQCEKYR